MVSTAARARRWAPLWRTGLIALLVAGRAEAQAPVCGAAAAFPHAAQARAQPGCPEVVAERWPDAGGFRGYGPAALEVIGFQALLNRFDHAFVGPEYDVSVGSIRRNLHSSWVVDRDPFSINQLGHPYQGSVNFGLARSNGLTFWESLGYAFAASIAWEIAGETTPPSRNDQVNTGFGGSFLGEALYRMANLVLEDGYGLAPRWKEMAAAVISPPLGLNRRTRPGLGSGRWASKGAAVDARLETGVSGTLQRTAQPAQGAAAALASDFLLDYGLPGKPGYEYRRPFDYFRFHARLSSSQGIERLSANGLLAGAPFASGAAVRGVAGVYGSYDYLAPQLFRVASSGVALGSNVALRAADAIALQAHASAGIGYTSTGTVRSVASRHYNYGFAPQASLWLRLVCAERVAFDVASREFFNGRLTRPESGGTDRVSRGEVSVTMLLRPHHALAVKYLTSRRRFAFPGLAEGRQRRDTIGLYYSYQPGRGLGVVSW